MESFFNLVVTDGSDGIGTPETAPWKEAVVVVPPSFHKGWPVQDNRGLDLGADCPPKENVTMAAPGRRPLWKFP